MQLSNQPPKGTSDWFPEEFKIRKYIFDTWRSVCTRFGYEEYLTPLVENADIYRAKSGEDIGGKELAIIQGKEGKELAVRPEMTPSVTRMISTKYREMQKPIRFFSIANFLRNEKPQRGRNREFWQLNFDIFGSDAINADREIIQIALEIMLSFNPPENSFAVYINNREVMDEILINKIGVSKENQTKLFRILDKWGKLSEEEFVKELEDLDLSQSQINSLTDFMETNTADDLIKKFPELEGSESYKNTKKIISELSALGYGNWIKFKPNIIRGFDYYDGMIFEVFDKNPENTRSLFGGGRYNGLAKIFGQENFPAVGCAPGDETIKLFLESWDLLDQVRTSYKNDSYYFPIISNDFKTRSSEIANILRKDGKNVTMGLEIQQVGKAIEYANKRGYDFVVLYGENEAKKSQYTIKNMKTGEQENNRLNL